ncbi:hypothetical protein [Streptomyces sp. NPDC102487]|uniref:hypothetical protein n=1 Tax=Streptomyces sp. NPDC102487 TaxID=3366182 RepID=UPI00381AA078
MATVSASSTQLPLANLRLVRQSMEDRTRLQVTKKSTLAMGAALRYVVGEIVEGAAEAAVSDGKKKILPKHIGMAVIRDADLSQLPDSFAAGKVEVSFSGETSKARSTAVPSASNEKPAEKKRRASASAVTKYKSFIKRLLRSRGRSASLTDQALTVLALMATAFIRETVTCADTLGREDGRKVLTADDILSALALVLKGELQQHAVAAAGEEATSPAPGASTHM